MTSVNSSAPSVRNDFRPGRTRPIRRFTQRQRSAQRFQIAGPLAQRTWRRWLSAANNAASATIATSRLLTLIAYHVYYQRSPFGGVAMSLRKLPTLSPPHLEAHCCKPTKSCRSQPPCLPSFESTFRKRVVSPRKDFRQQIEHAGSRKNECFVTFEAGMCMKTKEPARWFPMNPRVWLQQIAQFHGMLRIHTFEPGMCMKTKGNTKLGRWISRFPCLPAITIKQQKAP